MLFRSMHHRVHAAAEFYVDVLEYCWASAEHYKKTARGSYREWIHDVFAGSVVMQGFYLANEGWYPGLKNLRDSGLCTTASGHEFFTTTTTGAEMSVGLPGGDG